MHGHWVDRRAGGREGGREGEREEGRGGEGEEENEGDITLMQIVLRS